MKELIMNFPHKLQQDLTKACIVLNNAKTTKDIASILSLKLDFENLGYPFPRWLNIWLDWFSKQPLLTAEEYSKQSTSLSPCYGGMGSTTNYHAKDQAAHKQIDNAIIKANCNNHPAKRNLAYVIASMTLLGLEDSDDLGYEWHCKMSEHERLTYNPLNHPSYSKKETELLVQILERETAFWKVSMVPPGGAVTKSQNHGRGLGM
jgi:hypothetical protein